MFEQCFYRLSVKALVLDNQNRFLLALEDDGYWDLLGGGLEHNENPKEALAREIEEESGLTATWISPTPLYVVTALRQSKKSYTANIIYRVKLSSLDFTASDECQDLRFFDVTEAKQQNILPNVAAFLDVYDPSTTLVNSQA